MTTMPVLKEFTQKWRHKCYQPLTEKYPAKIYLFKQIVRFQEILEVTMYFTSLTNIEITLLLFVFSLFLLTGGFQGTSLKNLCRMTFR